MAPELKSMQDVAQERDTPCKSTIRLATAPVVTMLFTKHRVPAEVERTKIRRVNVPGAIEMVVVGAAGQSVRV